MESEDWVKAVYTIGFIFLTTPLVLSVSVILIAALTSANFGIDGGTFALTSVQAAGFVAMLYPRIRRWRQRRREQSVL